MTLFSGCRLHPHLGAARQEHQDLPRQLLSYLPQREAADERQQKLHDAAVEKAAKLQDYVDRNLVRASTTKMAQSRRRQLEKLEIVEAPTAEAWELNFRFEYDIEPYDELVIMKT